jgi:hypothetical protein
MTLRRRNCAASWLSAKEEKTVLGEQCSERAVLERRDDAPMQVMKY